MRKIVFLSYVVCFLTGCQSLGQSKVPEYASVGSFAVEIGNIQVQKNLKYSGKMVQEKLAIKVDDQKNIILLAGESSPDEVAILLPKRESKTLLENLIKLQKLRDSGQTGPLKVGNISVKHNSVVASEVDVNFNFYKSRDYWECFMILSGYDIYTLTTPHFGTPGGKKLVRLVLTPEEVGSLMALIEKADAFSTKEMKRKG